MIAAEKIAARFPHGLGTITVLKVGESCPLCKLSMQVWVDGEHPVCFVCSTGLELAQSQQQKPEARR